MSVCHLPFLAFRQTGSLNQMMRLTVDDDGGGNGDDELVIAAVNIYGAITMCQDSSKCFLYNELIHFSQQIF